MNRYLLNVGACLYLVAVISCHTASPGTNRATALISINSQDRAVSARIFPAFTAANEKQPVVLDLNNDDKYESVSKLISLRYRSALKDCNTLDCLAGAFKISEEESQVIVSKLPEKTNPKPLAIYSGDHIADAISNEIKAVNYILDVYLGVKEPRYPKIDKASRLADPQEYLAELKKEVSALQQNVATAGTFYHLPWLTALKVLSLNGRDEAGRYPAATVLNNSAFKKVKSVDWRKYKYSAMLVPGLGPQKAGIALDRGGAKRCELAAAQYKKGLAPFIIVSGGHVHPDKTPFSEGVEMKKYLVEKLKVPGSAVVVEPYARHTTTNIRNAARLVYELGLPEKMPVAIVTDIGQGTYVMFMKGRFMEELGYLPYEELSKAKSGVPYFIPSKEAMKINPTDPLDP